MWHPPRQIKLNGQILGLRAMTQLSRSKVQQFQVVPASASTSDSSLTGF